MVDPLLQNAVVSTRSLTLPCGTLLLGAVDGTLAFCDWESGWHRATVQKRIDRFLKGPYENRPDALLDRTEAELREYWAGKRRTFDLPLLFLGTDFQKDVWNALLDIPWGETVSYGDLARRIGRPKATRAVGVAVGENPFSIIVPCHRVIGKDGSITGYGGGLDAKRMLLGIEGVSI
ncbi:methylated-DNA--[protein]-cysteine S-methyltransferase [uncultured Sutterella sp.]|uniref:methylated-DNA--[protein]-cysteine S-methyltransferase n=1 Tax=uncultured Sutterella sp. TaxID=286133 RepID=UPI00261160AA|nr:methylated-DNA--[protein]-cysteine S-methyltransferase [uncultured Sutterella sp.]